MASRLLVIWVTLIIVHFAKRCVYVCANVRGNVIIAIFVCIITQWIFVIQKIFVDKLTSAQGHFRQVSSEKKNSIAGQIVALKHFNLVITYVIGLFCLSLKHAFIPNWVKIISSLFLMNFRIKMICNEHFLKRFLSSDDDIVWNFWSESLCVHLVCQCYRSPLL